MKRLWTVILLAATAYGAGKRGPDVVVYLHHGAEDPAIMGRAEAQAQKMLANAGITVDFRLGTPDRRELAEVVEAVLVDQQDPEFRPGSLAFSALGAKTGMRIEVFYNRVRASGPAILAPFILAHVLVHEITHVLEGVERHSDAGVMKASWNADDFRQMARSPLPFAAEDIHLIQAWTERHGRILLAGRN